MKPWHTLLAAAHASAQFLSNNSASGFPTTKVYRHTRRRQKLSRLSRRANRQ